MPFNLSPVGNVQFVTNNGVPYVGLKIFTYDAGTSTKRASFTDSTGVTSHTNPIIVGADGRSPSPIYLLDGVGYKILIAAPSDTDPPTSPFYTWDSVYSIAATAPTFTLNEWTAGPTPTYVSGTQFSLVGNQTATFHIGRRVRATISGGDRYGTITNSVFGAVTTVTLELDSGTLDVTLSAVAYGLVSAVNPSINAASLTLPNILSGVNQFSNVKNAMSSDVAAYAWAGANTRATDFGALGFAAVFTITGSSGVAVNAYYDGTNWIRKQVAGATLVYTELSTGNIVKAAAGSGAAGSIITFSTLFTLSTSGRMTGVGNLSDSGVANTVVQRNSSGIIENTYYYMTADDIGTGTPTRVPVETSTDGVLRWQTLANFRSQVATKTIITAAGAGTYTTPSGATKLVVKGLGGGAGGGGGRGGAGGGGGGSAGAMDELLILSPASSYPYVVGPGGPGGPANTDGSNGTATSFNGISLGKGGLGGKEGATRTGGASVTGGKLGGASGGGTATAGGSPSLDSSGAGGDGAGTGESGGGGSSLLAPGANGVAGGVVGNPGTLGSGGSGGGAGGVQTGGAGGDGVLIVEAYFN